MSLSSLLAPAPAAAAPVSGARPAGEVPAVRAAREAASAGDWARAEALLTAALAGSPADEELLAALGALHLTRGDAAGAVTALERAAAAVPGSATIQLNLGVALRRCGDLPGAVAAARRACCLRPGWAAARLNLGNALAALGCHAAAESELRTAVAIGPGKAEPGDPGAVNALGALLIERGRLEEAVELLRHEEERGGAGAASFNLGVALRRLGRWGEAEAALRRAIRREPGGWRPHFELSLLLLATGRWAEGWREYEWRWRGGGTPAPRSGRPQSVWDGASRGGLSLLLCAEQGAGDLIQFVRFADRLAADGEVWIEAPARLAGLLSTAPGVAGVVEPEEDCPWVELQLPLLSVPRVLGLAPDELPAPRRYLRAPAGGRPRLEWRLGGRRGGCDRLRVGLVWSGDPANPMNADRSVEPEAFARLAEIPGVDLWSLQYRDGGAAPARLRRAGIRSLGGELGDFASTAGVIERLDLTISVDTSACHLAAALGRPVWTLLGRSPDWRWERSGETSRWYPTMRLFRQRRPGDWSELLGRVDSALRSLAG